MMECTNWSQEDWATLLFTIQRENCILMLGPDASTEEIDGQVRPLTEVLARELAERLKPETRQNLDPANLTQVAQYYRMEAGRNDLEARVCSFYEARQQITNQIHDDLAALPFAFTLTSTPDLMFCNALQKQNKTPLTASYNYLGKNPEMVKMGAMQNWTLDKLLAFPREVLLKMYAL